MPTTALSSALALRRHWATQAASDAVATEKPCWACLNLHQKTRRQTTRDRI